MASFASIAAADVDQRAGDDALNGPITIDEILKAMAALNNGKAPSPLTGVPNELLKYGGRAMAELLMPLFSAVWEAAALPAVWTQGVIQYFYKAGDPSDVGNYRGITLLDVVGKLFHKVLAGRLARHAMCIVLVKW